MLTFHREILIVGLGVFTSQVVTEELPVMCSSQLEIAELSKVLTSSYKEEILKETQRLEVMLSLPVAARLG
jgi:hypothetical protein